MELYKHREGYSYGKFFDKLQPLVTDILKDYVVYTMINSPKDVDNSKKIIFRPPHLTQETMNQASFLLRRCDAIIFQSNFSLEVYVGAFGKINKPYKVLNNCCFPSNTKTDCNSKKIMIAGDFIRHSDSGIYSPNKLACLETVLEWLDGKYDIELIGTIPEQIQPKYNLSITRSSEWVDLEGIRARCPIYLHTILFDTCPNTAIEALACEQAVIGFDNGGIRDLTSNLAKFDKRSLLYTIDNVLKDIDNYCQRSRIRAILLSPEKYVNNLESFIENIK